MEEELKDISYEKALERLEEILRALDQKDLELERAISLYEEGLHLIHLCEQKLKEAKSRVEVIIKTKEGFITENLERAKELLKNG
uniref:Exodeoxyribonuclease 7 small subunit n=1 Tax=Caldimicrobium thiodismutans TaxID=1653476 RepID=A0A832GMP4_9BACT